MSEADKSLVVFGCGYVGTEVARQGMNRGFRVTALTRNEDQGAKLREMGIPNVIVDRLDSSTWHDRIPSRQAFVLNSVSAAAPGVEGYRESYLEGQKSILRWAARGHVRTMVYTSSTTVYPHRDGGWVTEDDAPDDLAGLTPTGQIVRESEQLLQSHPPSIDRWFVLRLAGIYGPGRHYLLDRLRSGDRTFPGDGGAYLNLIHRDDVTSAIWQAFFSPPEIQSTVCNVTDDEPVQRAELLAYLADRLGIERPGCEEGTCQPTKMNVPERLGALPRRTAPPFAEGLDRDPTTDEDSLVEAGIPRKGYLLTEVETEADGGRRANEEAEIGDPDEEPSTENLAPLLESQGEAAPRRRRGPLPNRRVRNERIKELMNWHPIYPSYQAGYGEIFRELTASSEPTG